MAHSQLEGRAPLKAGSAMGAFRPISFILAGLGASSLSETVFPAGSVQDMPFGILAATVATAGDPVTYWQRGDVGKAIAGASLGAGALVGVGSNNGLLVPYAAAGGPASANLVVLKWQVGVALKNAAAGDVFPVAINPALIL